jgi:hypothetical protein
MRVTQYFFLSANKRQEKKRFVAKNCSAETETICNEAGNPQEQKFTIVSKTRPNLIPAKLSHHKKWPWSVKIN